MNNPSVLGVTLICEAACMSQEYGYTVDVMIVDVVVRKGPQYAEVYPARVSHVRSASVAPSRVFIPSLIMETVGGRLKLDFRFSVQEDVYYYLPIFLSSYQIAYVPCIRLNARS
jgi:hypothetical protein